MTSSVDRWLDTRPSSYDDAASTLEPSDVEAHAELEAIKLNAVLEHVATASLVATAFAFVLSYHLSAAFGDVVTQTWLAVKIATALPRVFLGLASLRHHRFAPIGKWRRILLVSLAIDGAVWGLAGIWGAREPIDISVLVLASLVGVATIATFGLQVDVSATRSFILPILVPLMCTMALRADAVGVFGACATALIVAQSLLTARATERRVTRDFLARRRLAETFAERAALEAERARVRGLQEALVARSSFLAKVSHELRSPLQGIVSALDVLEMRRLGPEVGEDELVDRIRRSSTLLHTQLRDLLTLAKGQAGQLSTRPEVFEAVALVAAISESSRGLASAKGLGLRIDAPAEPIFVVADGPRIDQILTNLVVNAIKYTDDGEVCVTLRPYASQQRTLRFEVADTGPGLPAEAREALLASHFVDAPFELQGAGSGLGLAIVRTLVTLLSGHIVISSDGPHGTVIQLDVPAEPARTDHEDARAPDERRRLLIVDDRHDVLDGLASVAAELGFECDLAASAAVAANLLAARPYHAVLLDIEMPQKSGTDIAMDSRRGAGPNRETRFLGLTAGDIPDEARVVFDACLTKPVDRATLRQALGIKDSGFRPSQPGLWTDEVPAHGSADGQRRREQESP